MLSAVYTGTRKYTLTQQTIHVHNMWSNPVIQGVTTSDTVIANMVNYLFYG